MATPDRIEREIHIRAPVARVWELVSEPGWWISDADGDRSGQTRRREDGLEVVDDPRHGRFPIQVVALQPPHRAAFRWAFASPGEAPRPGNSTLVEFFLSERGGGTLLRVVESGFQSLAGDRDRLYEGNVKGWALETEILRKRAE
jgi:uncharacterized protein YndB with AHSA1/START domain